MAAILTELSHHPFNPAAVTGVLNRPSTRVELHHTFGQRGKPALNAVIATDENSNAAAHLARNIADREFEVLGTNATTALVTHYAEGGIKLTTAGADNDQIIILPHLDTDQTAWTTTTWGTDKQVEWDGVLSTGSSVADVTIYAGLKLTNTSVVATDNDQAFFRVTAAGNWSCIYSIGGTDTTVDSGVTVAASTIYRLRIQIDSARLARFWINDVLVATSTALSDATDLIPYVGIHANTGAAKHMYLHEQAISRVRG